MWRWYTPQDRREWLGTLALGAVLALAVAVAIPVSVGVWLGPYHLNDVPEVLLKALRDPLHPGRLYGLGTLGSVTVWVAGVLGVLAGIVVGVVAARTYSPTGRGFATRSEVRSELSDHAAARKAKQLRPDVTGRGARRRLAPSELAIPLHKTSWGTPMWLPLENAAGVIAPQQSGKSLMWLLGVVVDAPGACLMTSTKLDVLLLTAMERERHNSPVSVFDLTGSCPWPTKVRWNPITGCTTVQAANRRARALMAGSNGGATDLNSGGNHQFFVSRATDVLTSLLLAAALHDVPLESLVRWAQSEADQEPVTILSEYPQFESQRRILREAQGLVPETRGGVFETLRDGISCLSDATVVENCIPRAGEEAFSVGAMLDRGGTVYVIGSETEAATQASLVTAFVEHVLEEGQRRALANSAERGYERLSPPLVCVLDELTNICPLPRLPDTVSDSAGRGIVIVWAAQSLSQLQHTWGEHNASTLLDNTTAITVLGGLKSDETLRWVSTLAGERDEERVSRQKQRMMEPITRHVSQERVDALPPAAVRTLPRGRAVVLVRHLPPIIARLQPAWKRRDWKQLTADRDILRSQTQTRTLDPVYEPTMQIEAEPVVGR